MGTSQAKDGAIVDPFLSDTDVTLHHGDACEVLRELPEKSVHMCVTSPPFYGLRDYGVEGQIGLEDTPEEWTSYIAKNREYFETGEEREVAQGRG